MYSSVRTAILNGIKSVPISVEVDISSGLPVFDMVGNLSAEVKEAKERVKTALHNCNIALPTKRITINLTPANIRKSGTSFDLSLAVALLVAIGEVPSDRVEDAVFVGELNLKGQVLPVNGILPIIYDELQRGYNTFVVPWENYQEAKLIPKANIIPVKGIMDLIDYLCGCVPSEPEIDPISFTHGKTADFAEVNGQAFLKRACEVAASGMHNMLIVGPPGAGKTMLAERMPSILPPLTYDEQLEIAKIYSVCGMLDNHNAFSTDRPFRSPHHTITQAALIGGGMTLKPGEISLAHNGILFLDELTEFRRGMVDLLRQPMEEKSIHLERGMKSVVYPSKFILLGAMNPCHCGYYPDMQKCTCTLPTIKRYFERLSQPLIDRIDICVEAPTLSFADISAKRQNESSKDIRARVCKTHAIQNKRYADESFSYNSDIPASKLDEYCKLGEKEYNYMRDMYDKLGLTARTYHKILRVARTIADMEEATEVKLRHLNEAVCYRNVMDKYQRGNDYDV